MHLASAPLARIINAVLVATVIAGPACAQLPAADERYVIDIPPQALGSALQVLSTTTKVSVVAATGAVKGRATVAVRGSYTFDEAITALLAGTGLRWSRSGSVVVVTDASARNELGAAAGEIVVTGSRIRGAPVASPVIRLEPERLRNAGLATLTEAIRSIPQNFGGGQNPGIGVNVPEGSGGDVGGGSSINLRGLGSDATLTLLNGRRLSYSAARQSIDVSAIPLGAVERIEIVPDGASALFGSDAVAGVANIVLRRDMDGFETRARLGSASDGGYFDQLYAATGGKRWASGGVLLAYEYGDSSGINAEQRSYTASRRPGLTLYPPLRRHSALATAHQDLGKFSLAMDGLYNKRWSDSTLPLNDAGDLVVSSLRQSSIEEAWAVAPSIKLALPAGWLVDLAGSYGWNRVDYGGEFVFDGETSDAGSGFYRNRQRNVELSGNGQLIALPAGDAKLATGIGYRANTLFRFTGVGGSENIDQEQESYYAFGELAIPLVSPGMDVGFVERLSASAAVRYERYPGVGEVTTPKLGLIYAPGGNFDMKASWGRSFRAPTLYQQFQPRTTYLTRARGLGGTDLPATATALIVLGGNPDLRPERSANWSATVGWTPRSAPGSSIELSYFSVRYRNRIVSPIPFLSTALSDPLYAALVTRSPNTAAQAAVIAGTATFVNALPTPYDPASVAAIVDGSSINAGRQNVDGVDLLARQRIAVGSGTVDLSINASYIESEQQIGANYPVTRLAGILFNPPRWRGRGEAGWTRGPLTITGAVSYIGAVRDPRAEPSVRVPGMTPIDLTLRYRTPVGGLLGSIDLIASAQNLLNDKPSLIATSLPFDTPYDSTNYSPVGRFLSLTLAKSW